MNPPESFVPLTSVTAPPAPREFRVAVMNGHHHDHATGNGAPPGKPAGFQSLEALRPAAFNLQEVGGKKIGEPRVTVQRDGDRVTHLRIQCSCGQIMELACVYEPPAAS